MRGVCRPTVLDNNQYKVFAGARAIHHADHPAAASHWSLTGMVRGRHVSRCVLSRILAHLAHSARAAHVAHLARVEHVAHLADVEPAAHLAHQARLARLGL